MREFLSKWLDTLFGSFLQFGVRDIIDILMVSFIIYQLIKLTKETRAVQVLKGLGALVVGRLVCEAAGLLTISWLLNEILKAGSLVLVIIFQPELRRVLERVGRSGILGKRENQDYNEITKMAISSAAAMKNLSERKIGALIIFEGKTALGDIAASGTYLDADVSTALLEQIFEPNTPLHDGAAIIHSRKIQSAGCFLPLSENNSISRDLGTRHRAAIGVSEVSDCLSFVVSEETGIISMAQEGVLTRYVTQEFIIQAIEQLYVADSVAQNWYLRWLYKGEKK